MSWCVQEKYLNNIEEAEGNRNIKFELADKSKIRENIALSEKYTHKKCA